MTAMHPDMSWVGVLEHHARRTPDKPLAVFGDDTVTYGEMADRAAALAGGLHGARRRRRRRRRAALVQLHSSSSTTIFAANHLGAIAMPINWRLAAPEVRYILEHSEARALVCDDALARPRRRRDRRAGGRASLRVCIVAPASDGWSAARRPRRDGRDARTASPVDGRRRPPADVHVGDDRAPEGRDAHARQPGVEEPRAHRRVRLHRAPTSGSRAGRCTTSARSTSRPRRSSPSGATTIIHRVFDAADVVDEIERSRVTTVWLAPAMVQRDHGAARHRAARPLVGAGGHQRRREDADPVHRADPARRSRRRGSPTRTASPRRSRATRSSTATAS